MHDLGPESAAASMRVASRPRAFAMSTCRPVSEAGTGDGSSFGARLYELRTALGSSQIAIATAARISSAYYSALENSKRRPPPRAKVIDLARALQLSEIEVERLADLATYERFRIERERLIAPHVDELLVLIRSRGTRLRPALVERLKRQIQEG